MREVALEYKTIEQARAEITTGPAPEVEIIIPPARRLQPAAIERMMAQVVEVEQSKLEADPRRCRHGNLKGECCVVEVGYDCPHYINRDESYATPESLDIGLLKGGFKKNRRPGFWKPEPGSCSTGQNNV